MARQFWGVNYGEMATKVVTQGSSPTKDIELNVDLTKVYGDATYPTGIRKEDMLIALQLFMDNIVHGNWPPA